MMNGDGGPCTAGMAKKQSLKDGDSTGAAPDEPFDTATADATPVPPVVAPSAAPETVTSDRAPVQAVRPLIRGRVHRVTLAEARALRR